MFVIGAGICQHNEQAFLAGGLSRQMARCPEGQTIPVPSGCHIVKDSSVFLLLLISAKQTHHRVILNGGKGIHLDRYPAAGKAFGNHISLRRYNGFMSHP